MQINLIYLAQILLDFAKNIQSLITRVNKKKLKSKKKTFNYMPPIIKEKEKEIFAIEAIVKFNTIKLKAAIEFNIANIDLQSYTTINITTNLTDLLVSKKVARDRKNY
jgi:hypothetical protein